MYIPYVLYTDIYRYIYAYVDNLVIARTRYGITVWGCGGSGAAPLVCRRGALSALKILERNYRASRMLKEVYFERPRRPTSSALVETGKKNVKSTLVRAISANFLLNIKSAWNLNLVICKCFIFAFYLIFSAVLSSATTDVSKLWQEVGNDAKCGIQRETNKNLILIVQCLCES